MTDARATVRLAAPVFSTGDVPGCVRQWSAVADGRHVRPVDTDYGLREGAHVDPDGNLLRYGSPLGP